MSRLLHEIEAELYELWGHPMPEPPAATDFTARADWWDLNAERDERLAELYDQVKANAPSDAVFVLASDAINYRQDEARKARANAKERRARAAESARDGA